MKERKFKETFSLNDGIAYSQDTVAFERNILLVSRNFEVIFK